MRSQRFLSCCKWPGPSIFLRSEGIVHRDIKPGNILWVPETHEVKVIDLGFAAVDGGERRHDEEASSETTRGTAAFLSPESARGEENLDVRSDIYALGATLYQLVPWRTSFLRG